MKGSTFTTDYASKVIFFLNFSFEDSVCMKEYEGGLFKCVLFIFWSFIPKDNGNILYCTSIIPGGFLFPFDVYPEFHVVLTTILDK